jgi:hypothetical protein
MIVISCRCCEVRRRVRDRDGATPTMCDECHRHQGQLPDTQLARAQSHEAILRQNLTACRASEAKAQKAVQVARDRMADALASRGYLADRLVSAAENSGRHSCQAVELGHDPQVVEFASKHRERRGNALGR